MTEIKGILEIDENRGVMYFHDESSGITSLRICRLPAPIPIPVRGELLDITYGHGVSWSFSKKPVEGVTGGTKYIWQVIEQGFEPTGDPKYPFLPEIQCGIVDTFKEAADALSAWQGAEDDPPHRMYQIIPVLEDEEKQ